MENELMENGTTFETNMAFARFLVEKKDKIKPTKHSKRPGGNYFINPNLFKSFSFHFACSSIIIFNNLGGKVWLPL